ncbi:hypothetical protein [Pseudomonas brassicacearum]|uniref:hypothetical protein n=1 Tax=Pseudomonas brassicacearum TaxID=930166 RepID=UPI00126987EE|nr:hypothetical protein [Pseudomonas brassicacearum]
MFIFEIVTPGTRIAGFDPEKNVKIQSLISHLKTCFFEASTALGLYTQELNELAEDIDIKEIDSNFKRRAEIRKEIERELGDTLNCPSSDLQQIYEDIYFETVVRFNREKWSEKYPAQLSRHKITIFAKAFVQALDSFDKFLKILSEHENSPEALKKIHEVFLDAFPDLRGVRNTVQHMEDRSRGLGVWKKGKGHQPIDFKPPGKFISAAKGAKILMLNNIFGTEYGCTMADGHYGKVDVSRESMQALQAILQCTLDSFQWEGAKEHEPRA